MAFVVPVWSKKPGLAQELSKAVPALIFHEVVTPEADQVVKEAEIIIGDGNLLRPFLHQLPKLKWLQITSAGVDSIISTLNSNISFTITRYTGSKCGLVMAEYVLSNIIAHERKFRTIQQNQRVHKYDKWTFWQYRIVEDLTVGILGVGGIGNEIGRKLHDFGATVLGYGRSKSLPNSPEYSHISKYFTREQLPEMLQQCDYLVAVLPRTTDTDRLLDDDILENCREKRTVFINIGRGNIISEASIVKAIEKKWWAAAILDVVHAEPLPSTSRLWDMEEVVITPHVAGVNRQKHIAAFFRQNFELYNKKLPLIATLDLARGY